MRVVVDSNMLKAEELRAFLLKSRKNKAVITDYLMIEALKGDPLSKIFDLMKFLSEFPKQVVVLKNMRSVGALKGRRCGMTRRMIEKHQTKGFDDWCAGLAKAAAGDERHRRELAERGREADAEMDKIISAQGTYCEIIADEAKNYTKAELDILRTDQPYTPEMEAKLAERIVNLTVRFFEAHPDGVPPPSVLELPYTYLFRLAVCAYFQALVRIREGGAQNAKAEKIANDIVDATFAAQATYFQGLLSNDAKATALHRNAKHILKGFPVSPEKLKKKAA